MPWLLWTKALLFVIVGVLAAVLVLIESPSLRVAGALVVCVWAFCRAYYFAFYVVQHYIDPRFRFAGLTSVAAYLLRRRA